MLNIMTCFMSLNFFVFAKMCFNVTNKEGAATTLATGKDGGGAVLEKGNARQLSFYKLTKAKSTNKVSNVFILQRMMLSYQTSD